MGKADKIIDIPIADLTPIFHLGSPLLFYTVVSPGTSGLVAIIDGGAKAVKITFTALDSFNQVLFSVFPRLFNPQAFSLLFKIH
jgi:hypothetical protein